jgi:outer membrane receptor for ferric coprogen and ferric-rhodotorulic acid
MDISGPLNDDASLRGRVVGVYQNKQSFVDYLHNERNVLYGVLAYDLTPDTVVTTGLNWQKTRSVPDIYGVPFASDRAVCICREVPIWGPAGTASTSKNQSVRRV